MRRKSRITVLVGLMVCFCCPISFAEDILFSDGFTSGTSGFLNTWTIIETGDQQMTWDLAASALWAWNESSSGGNDQTIIFTVPVDTAGYQDLHASISYRSTGEDDYEPTDFIRIQGYGSSPLQGAVATIECTTEGEWGYNGPPNNPPTAYTDLGTYFETYSWDNPDFWFAIEVNTSLPIEKLLVDTVVVKGELIPEPATLALLAVGGLALIRRKRQA